MFKGTKKILLLLIIIGASFMAVGCSSSEDTLNEANYFFAAISRIERITPGGMGFTEEQAKEFLNIINPVVTGTPYTSELAEKMYKDANKLLTDEQKKLVDDNLATLGTQQGSGMGAGEFSGEGVPGSGAGAGMGAGAGTGVPGSGYSATGDSGINMFLRLDDIISTNYLE